MTATATAIRPRFLTCHTCRADVTAAQHRAILADRQTIERADAADLGDRLGRYAGRAGLLGRQATPDCWDADGNTVLCPACHADALTAIGGLPLTLPPAPSFPALPVDPALAVAPLAPPPAFFWACVRCGDPLLPEATGPGTCPNCTLAAGAPCPRCGSYAVAFDHGYCLSCHRAEARESGARAAGGAAEVLIRDLASGAVAAYAAHIGAAWTSQHPAADRVAFALDLVLQQLAPDAHDRKAAATTLAGLLRHYTR
jgi:hypothetical protein